MDPARVDPATSVSAPWHALESSNVLALLETTPLGLTGKEAARRLKVYGPNDLPEGRAPTSLRIFLRQFASPLIYVLLAAGLLALLIGDRWDSVFIFGVLLLNAVIGAVQEIRADASARALRSLLPQSSRVLRDGGVRQIDSDEVVPGDLVELESGVHITADLRLTESQGLQIDESLLTGESLPVAKDAAAKLNTATLLAERATMTHAGTAVVTGRAVGVVVATGQNTTLGGIGRSLDNAALTAAVTPLVERMKRLARQIGAAALALILTLAAVLALQGESWQEIALLGIALAVSAIPEGLPVAVTVALSTAASRMAERNVIVRALPAVEGLGACTLIASDKTGTLTMNRLTVERAVLADGSRFDREVWHERVASPAVTMLGRLAALCNEAVWPAGGVPIGDAVDVALLIYARETGNDVQALLGSRRLAVIPYEPSLRYAAAEIETAGTPHLVVKGAPEVVLDMCHGVGPDIRRVADEMAREGFRVLALAEGSERSEAGAIAERLRGLTFVGFVGLSDPLRPEAKDAVAKCAAAGISVRMLTGDHPETALAVARKLGLADRSEEVVTGADLAQCGSDPERIRMLVRFARVFARIEPAQKLSIVQALQAEGEIVAVTGDGVNDGPALRAANIGVAMGRGGTDVARGAADLVLADDNFASIVAGVEEGRITFLNVRKIVLFGLATGIAEIGMFLAALALGLPMPLTPVQLLWLNLVTNGVQDVALGFGRGEGDELSRPPRHGLASLLDRDALILMLPGAAVMTAAAVWLLSSELAQGSTVEDARNSVLLLTVLFQNAYLLSLRHLGLPAWRLHAGENRWLFLAITAATGLHLSAMHFGPLQELLAVAPISAGLWLYCFFGAATILTTTELGKLLIRHGKIPSVGVS